MRQLSVFLCHASQDKPAVRKMYSYLKQHGVQPWLDREDLLPGQDWEVEIPKALFASDVILVCLSKNSVNKEGYVQKEIVFALDKALEKPEGTIFVIPVKLEECDVPKRLSRYQWVDYYRTDGRKRLLMGLNVRAQGLDEDIIPVVMEDSRQRTPRPLSPKLEVKEMARTEKEPKKENSVEESPVSPVKQLENKPVQRKPFTKILDPSFLASSKAPSAEKNNILLILSRNWITVLSFLITIAVFFYVIFDGPLGRFDLSPEESLTLTPTPELPTSTSVPVLGIGSTMISEKDGMVMVYVPEGEFTMGSDASSDEQPIHLVDLDAFWIDQTEVTNEKYSMCVETGECSPPSNVDHYVNGEYAKHPVIYVSWSDAQVYCLWANRRLPTEAEWEKAARGTDSRKYPWGNQAPDSDLLDFNNKFGETTKVGNYPNGVSPYSAYDMAGNVLEWVNDWYDGNYYGTSPSSNPQGPTSGQYKVLRGGSWYYLDFIVRSADRNWYSPTNSNYYVGFRCSLSQP